MSDRIRVASEVGPKGKKVVAVAPDWPGLERGAKTEEAAVERLLAYVPRYLLIAKLAGMDAECAAVPDPSANVVERYPGTGSTDFWGISFSSIGRNARRSARWRARPGPDCPVYVCRGTRPGEGP